MLVLSRKVGEKLLLVEDGQVKITITYVPSDRHSGGTTIRLGIDAPKTVKILRSELAGDYLDPSEIKRING